MSAPYLFNSYARLLFLAWHIRQQSSDLTLVGLYEVGLLILHNGKPVHGLLEIRLKLVRVKALEKAEHGKGSLVTGHWSLVGVYRRIEGGLSGRARGLEVTSALPSCYTVRVTRGRRGDRR